MTSFQLIVLGMMLVLTPSLAALACFVWRVPVVPTQSERESTGDQSVQFDLINRHRVTRWKKLGEMPSLYVQGTTVQQQAHQRDNFSQQSHVRDREIRDKTREQTD
jgi:hypothetical protein